MNSARWSALTSMLLVVACETSGSRVLVDLKTDLAPGVEFTVVELSLDADTAPRHLVVPMSDYVDGVRIGEFENVSSGSHLVTAFVRADDELVVSQRVRVVVNEDRALTLVVTRDCRGVSCPAGGSATETLCLGGRCVEETCLPDSSSETCPTPECRADSECIPAATCAAGVCESGVCLFEDRGSCEPSQYCDPDTDCRALPTVDAGMPDGGTDVGFDAGFDGVIQVGSYTGTGGVFDVPVGFRPVTIIVTPVAMEMSVLWTDTMPAGRSKPMGAGLPLGADMITDATSDGFRVGSALNQTLTEYQYVAFAESNAIARGSYVGTGTNQSLTGIGFQPEWMFFADEDDGFVVVDFQGPSGETFRLTTAPGVDNGVESFDADGFTVGTRPFVNEAGRRFYYVAWRSLPGIVSVGSYEGVDATVTGLGVEPAAVIVKHDGDERALYRTLATGEVSFPFTAEGGITDAITALTSDGFTLGARAEVRPAAGRVYFIAFGP